MSPLAFLLEGLAAGAVPALLAAGLAIAHRSTGVLSFAHAAVGAAGAYAAWRLRGWGPGIGGIAAVLAGATLGLVMAPGAREALRRGRAPAVLFTLGFAYLVETGLRAGFGSDPKAYLQYWVGEAPVALPDGGHAARSDLATLLAVTLASGAAALGLGKTSLGRALWAVGSSRPAAIALGLNLGRLERLAWALSGAAAGLSGWLLAPKLGVSPGMLFQPMIAGFVAAALGGLDHPGRAFVAGLGLGLAERSAYLALDPAAAHAARWWIYAAGVMLSSWRRRDDR